MTPDAEPQPSLRERFERAIETGDRQKALAVAREMLRHDTGTSLWSFIRKTVSNCPQDALDLHPLRVALLSSFSSEFLHDPLVSYGFINGLRIEIYQAGFGQYRQEILDSTSPLYEYKPDVVILAVEGEDWAPALYRSYLDMDESQRNAILNDIHADMTGLIRTFRSRSNATLLLHNFFPPIRRQLGILDGQNGTGQAALTAKINEAVSALSREHTGVYVVDYAGLVSYVGAAHWYDSRMAHYAKAPIARPMLGYLAREYMKFFRALTGKTKKCLVVDLDNTLWGGIVGEEGVRGIKLGPTYPGSAYQEFQRELLNLQKRGVILAVASKNNEADVQAVFDSNEHMLLRREHFAVIKANWNPKPQSIVEIAEELNIGLDHMVFVDDNPAECEQVAAALPMVTVIALPKQPERYSETLLMDGLFDKLSLSAEDKRRSELYRQRAEAEALRARCTSLQDFYRSLEMVVVFSPVDEASLARAAQLTQKTNQFNVTTIRYSEAQLAAYIADPTWLMTTVQVQDRFGDHGIVGLMLAHTHDDRIDIDTFLLSCRVIGRTIETAMLAYLAQQAEARNIRLLSGRVVPTAKNAPARDLYERHGFKKVSGEPGGVTFWTLATATTRIDHPEWLKIIVRGASTNAMHSVVSS
jgi:FkbH-like protein